MAQRMVWVDLEVSQVAQGDRETSEFSQVVAVAGGRVREETAVCHGSQVWQVSASRLQAARGRSEDGRVLRVLKTVPDCGVSFPKEVSSIWFPLAPVPPRCGPPNAVVRFGSLG